MVAKIGKFDKFARGKQGTGPMDLFTAKENIKN
jgi:hypothetical protein